MGQDSNAHGAVQERDTADFYPWNFLNKAQRSASVERVTLEEWIKADRSRGKIGPAPRDLAFWAIEPDRIDEIKPVLMRNKVLFDYRDFERW